jgi:hypothetical protein
MPTASRFPDTIHSATSSVSTSGSILQLNLDIEFLSSPHLSDKKHIYVLVENYQAQYSNAAIWKSWGWWITPKR